MKQKERIAEVLVIVGIAAFAYYRYRKLTPSEKEKIHEEIKEIGQNVAKELVPQHIKTFLPAHWK